MLAVDIHIMSCMPLFGRVWLCLAIECGSNLLLLLALDVSRYRYKMGWCFCNVKTIYRKTNLCSAFPSTLPNHSAPNSLQFDSNCSFVIYFITIDSSVCYSVCFSMLLFWMNVAWSAAYEKWTLCWIPLLREKRSEQKEWFWQQMEGGCSK